MSNERVGVEEIELFPSLRHVHKWGAGVDSIDVEHLRSRNVTLTNSPGVNAFSVADHCIALMLSSARRLPECRQFQGQGVWAQDELVAQGVRSLRGATAGLIGMGAVGAEVARLCRALGMEVVYTKRYRLTEDQEADLGVEFAELDDVVKTADVLVIAASARAGDPPLLSAKRLSLMRPEVILINVARASLIDEEALVAFLDEHPLARACLDVVQGEPSGRLPEVNFGQAMITPHVAGRDSRAIHALNGDVVRALSQITN